MAANFFGFLLKNDCLTFVCLIGALYRVSLNPSREALPFPSILLVLTCHFVLFVFVGKNKELLNIQISFYSRLVIEYKLVIQISEVQMFLYSFGRY